MHAVSNAEIKMVTVDRARLGRPERPTVGPDRNEGSLSAPRAACAASMANHTCMHARARKYENTMCCCVGVNLGEDDCLTYC